MPKRVSRSRLVTIAGGLAIVAVIAWALLPAAVPVDLARVTRGPLRVTVDEEGETRVRDRFVVSTPLPGRLLRVELEPGDRVEVNQVVATLVPTDPALLDARTRAELEARVRAAAASADTARAERRRLGADLEFARRDQRRTHELLAAGLVSPERVDQADRQVRTLEEAVRSAEFAVSTAQSQREAAEAAVGHARSGSRDAIPLRSPVAGVVLKRLQESERTVTAAHPVLEIGDLGRMEIVSDLLSTDAVKVRPAQRVIIDQWGGGAPLDGRVRLVEPSGFTKISALGVEEQRVNVIVDFEDAAAAARQLGDGYRVEIRVVTWEQPQVLKVPASSLVRRDGRWAVYRVEADRARVRDVEAGQTNGLDTAITAGLAEGDTIVVYPSDKVADGVAIVPR